MGFDEAGDGHWDNNGGTWITNTATSLDIPCSRTFPVRGVAQYVKRRRRSYSPMISFDANTLEGNKARLFMLDYATYQGLVTSKRHSRSVAESWELNGLTPGEEVDGRRLGIVR